MEEKKQNPEMIDLGEKSNARMIRKTERFSLEHFKKWINLWWDYLRKKGKSHKVVISRMKQGQN